jgi:hypothetical protein
MKDVFLLKKKNNYKLNIMKNLKKVFYLFIAASLFLTSCEKMEMEKIEQQHPESQAMKTVANHLVSRLSALNSRPSGVSYRSTTALEIDYVLVNEFCFNFQYPITVVMSNNTVVTVNDSAELQALIISSTSALSVVGVQYPFEADVPISQQASLVTIHNDAEFNNLIGNACDYDSDGIANYLDDDIDGDGLLNTQEDLNGNGNLIDDDTDGNGIPNYMDADDDGDGILTADEDVNNNGSVLDDDTDGDGIANYLDTDPYYPPHPSDEALLIQSADYCFAYQFPMSFTMSDGSTITINNDTERHAINVDATTSVFVIDVIYPFNISVSGAISAINNRIELYDAINNCTGISPQGDEDSDSVLNMYEDLNGNGDYTDDDTDGDGTPNYLDTDDDGDGILTINEDANGNGSPLDDDTDGDGIPDYLDNN